MTGRAPDVRRPHPHPPPPHGCSLQAGTSWAPLRIVAEYGDTSGADAALVSWVKSTLVPAALARWGELLTTRPVVGPLYAPRQCASYYSGTTKCASYAGGGLTCQLGYGDAPVTVGADKLGPDAYYPSGPGGPPATMPAGTGWPGADTAVYVSVVQTSSCGSAGSGVLAYAASCARDQLDRPIVGRINLCPGSLSTSDFDFPFQLGVVVHELGHALGAYCGAAVRRRYRGVSVLVGDGSSGKTPTHAHIKPLAPSHPDLAAQASTRDRGRCSGTPTAARARRAARPIRLTWTPPTR
jgi:hypothetical protein